MTLTIEQFGAALLKSGDLDPVYIALDKAQLDEPTLHRLVLAYWCFYHLGVAANLAEIKNPMRYWEAMYKAALNETLPDGTKPWPRGSERRHFRGEQAVKPMSELIAKYKTATQAVRGMVGLGLAGTPRAMSYGSVSVAAQRHRGFGPWIAFKIADMAERVLGFEVDFSDCTLGIYKDPRQGAALLLTGDWQQNISDEDLKETVGKVVKMFSGYQAAGGRPRPFGIAEAETVLCKWKSHVKGHYEPGKDTREIKEALVWAQGALANTLHNHMPK
jgi:hypothetical protein